MTARREIIHSARCEVLMAIENALLSLSESVENQISQGWHKDRIENREMLLRDIEVGMETARQYARVCRFLGYQVQYAYDFDRYQEQILNN